MTAGRFITFEGGEGSGKSTQASMLADWLQSRGKTVVVTREPGGTPLGERIRELILSSRPALVAEFLLFAAARAEHVAARIVPALAGGNWVVCDRYIGSTRVYQGTRAGVDPSLIDVVEKHTSEAARPSLTFILDVPAATGCARASQRGHLNRYDAETLSYHDRIRQGFLDIAAREPARCTVIDGSRSAQEVADAVRETVSARLGIGA